MSKTALIVFPDEWLQFSPTILNMEYCLKERGYQVTVIAFDNDYFQNDGLVEHLVKVKLGKWQSLASRKLGKHKKTKAKKLDKALRDHAKKHSQYDLIIGADSIGFLAARKVYPDVVFLSLEVQKDDYFDEALQLGFKHMIIQTEERKEFLLGNRKDVDVTYIQNAPILPEVVTDFEKKPKTLLYVGKVDYKYGLESFIEALAILPKEYTLTLKGFKSDVFFELVQRDYHSFIEEKRLLFDFSYTPQEEIIESISGFSIGITGYDIELAKQDFNYYSSPAGKLFNYYAAAMPVIGIDIIGLKSVRDFDAGVLLKKVEPKAIAKAIEQIEQNYDHYSKKAYLAGSNFNFRKGFDSFLAKIE